MTVAPAEHSEEGGTADRPQTVSSGNGRRDWATQEIFGQRGEIEGLAEGIQAIDL